MGDAQRKVQKRGLARLKRVGPTGVTRIPTPEVTPPWPKRRVELQKSKSAWVSCTKGTAWSGCPPLRMSPWTLCLRTLPVSLRHGINELACGRAEHCDRERQPPDS